MKEWLRENRGLLIFLLALGCVRGAIADWNPIPSGSMRPTLLEGDVVLVDRRAYDLKLPFTDVALARTGEPQRGDVITFRSPRDGERLIKRVVGLPGDVIELRAGQLVLNGQPLAYGTLREVTEPLTDERTTPALRATESLPLRQHAVQFFPERPAFRDFGPVVVPADHYFFLGDSRDNSVDSRWYGMVARPLLIGRAHRVLVSADILANWWPRLDRFVRPIE